MILYWGRFSCRFVIFFNILLQLNTPQPGNRNKGKGNGAGLAWESQSHCFADKFGKPYTHSFGTDTQQRNCRTMFSIIIKLEWQLVYCKLNQINLRENLAYSVDLNI